jgi:hypothetical protein
MCDHSTVAESVEAGAPEIEITPAMIEAGLQILMDVYDAVGGPVDRLMAAKIFNAMLERASPANLRFSNRVL